MTKLYVIRKAGNEYAVHHVKTWKRVFYGTRAQCAEWIEHIGNDDSEYAREY